MWGKVKNFGEKLQTQFEVAENSASKMINQWRGIEETKDERFEAARSNFEKHTTCIELMYLSVKQNDKALTGLSNAVRSLAKQAIIFNSDENRIPGANDISVSCDLLCTSVGNYLEQNKEVAHNFKVLIEHLELIKKHIIERDRLVLEYDKQRHELANEQKKIDSQTLPAIQKRLESVKQIYETRNEEIIKELYEIYHNRDVHSELKLFFEGYALFFAAASTNFTQLVEKLSKLSPPAPAPYTPGAPVYAAPIPAVIPTSATPGVKRARALYPFTAETPTELSFRAGDIIVINDSSHPDWWAGENNGIKGELPSNYVELIA